MESHIKPDGVVIVGLVESLVGLANVGTVRPVGFGFVKLVDLVIGGPAGLYTECYLVALVVVWGYLRWASMLNWTQLSTKLMWDKEWMWKSGLADVLRNGLRRTNEPSVQHHRQIHIGHKSCIPTR
ncbi:hypothetical protein Tco_1222151 [Tanacetum coccineum]